MPANGFSTSIFAVEHGDGEGKAFLFKDVETALRFIQLHYGADANWTARGPEGERTVSFSQKVDREVIVPDKRGKRHVKVKGAAGEGPKARYTLREYRLVDMSNVELAAMLVKSASR